MAKIVFNATENQILTAAALAANEAEAQGMGFLHYRPDTTFTPDDMKDYLTKGGQYFINCDYVQGRCTKFAVWPIHKWDKKQYKGYKYMTGYETQDHYETWRTKYPTYADLLQAAGITDYKVVGLE